MFKILTIITIVLPVLIASYKSAHFQHGKSTIVQLFEWKWNDIADECERFLQHHRFGGVQISPPNENVVLPNRFWYERYQPVSYMLSTRSGNEHEFVNMTKRCNAVGVRIYVDAVINHMSATSGIGTGGNRADVGQQYFPGVPYGPADFHANCEINNWKDKNDLRNCYLLGLLDLNQSVDHVRTEIINYMNRLIDFGVAGFRIDAAAHISPDDLGAIYKKLNNLSTTYGFNKDLRPFIYQEVSTMDREYAALGALVEFDYSRQLSDVFRRNAKMASLMYFPNRWGLIDGLDALAFIDNHDTQRGSSTLTYKEAKEYKMAIAFMLAHPYGTTRIMSSYFFDKKEQGPPKIKKTNEIQSPTINSDGTCGNGWVCEHRWREIFSMVEFRSVVDGTEITNWWTNQEQQLAFCRGNKGFVAFTNWGDIKRNFNTCMPRGTYCDVISGSRKKGKCTGKKVEVDENGWASITLGALEFNGVLAIHQKSRI